VEAIASVPLFGDLDVQGDLTLQQGLVGAGVQF
jgi:hypothetical protein